MDKKRFERFISRYNLGGACESVVYSVSDTGTISTRGIAEDKNVLCEVQADNMGVDTGDYGVFDTARLRSLLGVLTEQLSVGVRYSNDRATGLTFADGNTEATFVLADASAIPKVPTVEKFPNVDLNITLDEQFINTFIRAKSALAEVDTFTIMSDGSGNTADIVIGYSSMNTNRIKLSVTTQDVCNLSPISFSAKYLREILVANKDIGTGLLEVSSKGISRVTFSADGMTSTYYLLQINTGD